MVPPSTCLYSGCQTKLWTMCLYKLSAGICSQSGLGSSKCKRLSENHLSTLSSIFRVCLALQKKKKRRSVTSEMYSFLCLYSTRKYLIIRNLFRFNLGKRMDVSHQKVMQGNLLEHLSVSCKCICTKLTRNQRHPRTSQTKRCLRILFCGHKDVTLDLPWFFPPTTYIHHWKAPTHSAHLQNILQIRLNRSEKYQASQLPAQSPREEVKIWVQEP